ncbi:MHC class II regulatory factor RFX1 isoform X2 [Lissotriton helveticus]
MATPAYVTELQAAQQPQAASQVPQQPQQQYVAELQTIQAQKQFVSEIQSPQPQSGPQTPSPVPQQYIVVTVSDGVLRPNDAVSEHSPGTPPTQVGVPTQVVQHVQAAQQRLVVQSTSQAGKGPQVALAVHTIQQQVHSPPERSTVQSHISAAKPGSLEQLQVHGVQPVLVTQERSVVQSTTQVPKSSPVQQLAVQGLQPVHTTQENSVSQVPFMVMKRKEEQKLKNKEEELQQLPASEQSNKLESSVATQQLACRSLRGAEHRLHYLQSLQSGSEQWVELVRVLPQQKVVMEQMLIPNSERTDQRVEVQRLPQVLVFGTSATALKVQQLQQVPVQHVYQNQVQYVEGGDASYTASTISGAYPYTETQLYSQNPPATYYESQDAPAQDSSPATSQAVAGSGSVPMYVSGGQIVSNQSGGSGGGAAAGTYVIPGGYLLGSSSQTYSHTTRASPATVQWLLDNYETAEGVSLPRSTLYCHYLLHCQEQKLEPVNAASFGKLIRSVFMGLRTRRLGTRGNSKYHYYGLRIKANSALLRLMEDQQHLAMRQQPFSQKQRLKPVQKMDSMTNGVGVGQQQSSGLSEISAQVQQYQPFLDASRSLPEFVEIDLQGKALPVGLGAEDVKEFQLLYREHCEAIVDVMINLQFTLVETLWKTFWRYNANQPSENTLSTIHDEAEKRLPRDYLIILSKYEPVLKWTKDCDNLLYQGLVEILIPEVLRPIPSALTQAIRNFAKSLESWLSSAMMNIPEEMVRVKVAAASAFAQTLRRYTSLNHLAQAARAVLQNTAQINQMLSDLNRVDFTNVQEQASWVCRCEDRVVQRLEQDFKLTLQQQNSLEQWAAWLDGVVNQVLKPYQGNLSFPKAAKLFLLKWSFYSSMVIRDLTLRSAASFGSFHLIRLLYDEYMYYLIEHRVAQAKGETPIAVMGEFANLGSTLNPLDPDKDEEEEEEDESDDEMSQDISLHTNDSATLVAESMEPPLKLARTDSRGLFVQAPPST